MLTKVAIKEISRIIYDYFEISPIGLARFAVDACGATTEYDIEKLILDNHREYRIICPRPEAMKEIRIEVRDLIEGNTEYHSLDNCPSCEGEL